MVMCIKDNVNINELLSSHASCNQAAAPEPVQGFTGYLVTLRL